MTVQVDEQMTATRSQEHQSERVRWVLEIREAGNEPRFDFHTNRAALTDSDPPSHHGACANPRARPREFV
jgi:hypothetical protein